MSKIIIDAGHGGYDNGASYNNRREKDDTLRLALAVGELLKADGFEVVYTRTDDTYTSPSGKAKIGNESNGDLFVSFHRNSSPTPNQYNGAQTLIYNNEGIKVDIAEAINSALEKTGFQNLGTEERPNLAVLRRTKMPAILVEVGFINSDKDNEIFDKNFDEIANQIANAIKSFYTPVAASIENTSIENTSMRQLVEKTSYKYQLLVGCYRNKEAATQYQNTLLDYGYDSGIYFEDEIYQLRIGAYETKEAAATELSRLRNDGIEAIIVSISDTLEFVE